jgi:hypothetical protein
MKNKMVSYTIIIFLVGIVAGFFIVFSIGAIASYLEPRTLLTGRPKIFGDIKILSQKARIAEDVEIPKGLLPEYSQALWMTKDNIPFLLITQDKTGKASSLFIVKKDGCIRPVFWMKPSSSPGKWCNAMYSCVRLTEKPCGEAFKDFDFDGRFDFKLAADGNGISRFISVDGSWQKIEHYDANKMEASIGKTRYVFDTNTGYWQLVQ